MFRNVKYESSSSDEGDHSSQEVVPNTICNEEELPLEEAAPVRGPREKEPGDLDELVEMFAKDLQSSIKRRFKNKTSSSSIK